MKTIARLFLTSILILYMITFASVVFAATYATFEALMTEFKSITFVKRATINNGEPVIVIKADGLMQDVNVRHCWLIFPDRLLQDGRQEQLLTQFEAYAAYNTRNPEVPLGENEYLCWPVFVTGLWLNTLQTVAINTATNQPTVVEPNLRCDTNRPYDGEGRTNPEGWVNWYYLRNTTNDSTIAVKCIEQTGSNVTISYREPTENNDGTRLNDLKNVTVYFETTSNDGLTTSRYTLAEIPATSVNGGGVVQRAMFVPIPPDVRPRVAFVARAFDLSGQHSVDSNFAYKEISYAWKESPTNIALNIQ